MGLTVLFSGCTCVLIVFHFWTLMEYQEELARINPKAYKMKRFLGMGLFLLDQNLMKKRVIKPNYSILQLYGRQAYAERVRLFEAEKIALMILVVFGTILMVLLISIKSLTWHRVEEINKAAYGEGKDVYRYSYELEMSDKTSEEELTIVVPEQKPTVKQRALILEKCLGELPQLIMGSNESLEHVTEPLELISTYESGHLIISWESENRMLLLNNGEIRYNNLKTDGEKVNIKAILTCYEQVKEVVYEVILFHRPLSQQEEREQVVSGIAAQLSQDNLKEVKENDIILPKTYEGYEANVTWFNKKKVTSVGQVLLGGIFLVVLFYQLKIYELKDQVKKRDEALLKEFPSWVNKFALLLNAGMTFKRAWEKIASDYVKNSSMSREKQVLYEEMLMTLEDIEKGMSEIKAYEAFGQRCKCPEILRFTAVIVQNIKKGSHLLIGALQQQAKEALCSRQDYARKKGEKASTRLILPMSIMFVAILIIVMAPVLITLKI